jgi:hypothetical protein
VYYEFDIVLPRGNDMFLGLNSAFEPLGSRRDRRGENCRIESRILTKRSEVREPRAGLKFNFLANLRLLGLCVLAENNAGVCAIKTGGGELDSVALWRCGEPVE